MFKLYSKSISLIGLFLLLFLMGCSSDNNSEAGSSTSESNDKGEVELTLVEWDSEIASSHVVGKVLTDLGYDVTITPLDMAVMWESVASGQVDGMLAAWLPTDQAEQFKEYGDRVVDLGPSLEGAKTGLVVPEYMDINSIEDLDDQTDKVITGIDPGAGVVAAAKDAVDDYDNLDDFEVQTSSGGAMMTALEQAYENEEPIVVTGWSPHWKFIKYDLKYLEDPKLSFGEEEHINTMVREDLEEDKPEVYQVLDSFYWNTDDMEEVMLDISEGTTPEEAANKWVEENDDKVSEWTEGIE